MGGFQGGLVRPFSIFQCPSIYPFAMKFDKTAPCSECPFLKTSAPGWLGHDTPAEVLQKVHGEGGYPCHTDMGAHPRLPNGAVDCTGVQQCAGAVIHANLSDKIYRDRDLEAMQRQIRDKGNVMGIREFLDRHKS